LGLRVLRKKLWSRAKARIFDSAPSGVGRDIAASSGQLRELSSGLTATSLGVAELKARAPSLAASRLETELSSTIWEPFLKRESCLSSQRASSWFCRARRSMTATLSMASLERRKFFRRSFVWDGEVDAMTLSLEDICSSALFIRELSRLETASAL